MKILSGSRIGLSVAALFLTVVFAAAGCASLSGSQAKSEEATELRRSGYNLLMEGKYWESAAQLTTAIGRAKSMWLECKMAPDCEMGDQDIYERFQSAAYSIRASAYIGDNQFEQALADARTAIRYDGNNAHAHHILIYALLLANDNAAAQKEFQLLKKLEPDKERTNEDEALVNSANAAEQIKRDYFYRTPLGKGWMAYNAGEYKKAIEILRPLADQGDVKAQFLLGTICVNGFGLPRDNQEAAKWFQKAADQGYKQGQFMFGFMCVNGLGVPQDNQEAAKWFQKAADQGYAEAQVNLGIMCVKGQGMPVNLEHAYMWFELARVAGDQNAPELKGEVEKKMSTEQIKKAKALVREWNEKHQVQK